MALLAISMFAVEPSFSRCFSILYIVSMKIELLYVFCFKCTIPVIPFLYFIYMYIPLKENISVSLESQTNR